MLVLLVDRYETKIDPLKYIDDFDSEKYDNVGVTELEVRYALQLA